MFSVILIDKEADDRVKTYYEFDTAEEAIKFAESWGEGWFVSVGQVIETFGEFN